MHMSNRSITSQEYKLMLKAERFQNRTEGSNGFMTLVATLVENQGGQTTKSFHEKERRVWYLDTPTFALRQNGFILRLRSEMEATKPFNLTLKCRHSDRYLAASTKVSVSEEAEATYKEDRGDIESKFEADILGQSVGKFSHSTSIRMNKYPELRTVAEIAAIFPVLEALPVNKDTPIVVVNGFEAYEIKCEAGEIDFGQKPKVKPCLSFGIDLIEQTVRHSWQNSLLITMFRIRKEND